MSATALVNRSPISLLGQTSPIFPLHEKESGIQETKNVATLASITSAVAMGCMFIPKFTLGLGVGALMLISQMAISVLFNGEKKDKKEETESNPYRNALANNLLGTAIFVPMIEEAIFRGILCTTMTKVTLLAFPAAAAPFFGLGMSLAVASTIALSSVLFGAAHLRNPHKGARRQAFHATTGGVVLGSLFHYCGIGAATAAHIANNTLASLMIMYFHKPSIVPSEHRRLHPDFLNGRKTTLISKP